MFGEEDLVVRGSGVSGTSSPHSYNIPTRQWLAPTTHGSGKFFEVKEYEVYSIS